MSRTATLEVREPPLDANAPPAAGPSRTQLLTALAVTAGVAAVVAAITVWAYKLLPPAMCCRPTAQARAPGMGWLGAWSWWDGAWYVGIAEKGYFFRPGQQSSVAFFPGYPILVRLATPFAGGNAILAGFMVTLAAGVSAVVLFYRWCHERLGAHPAAVALLVLLSYPASFYLFGKLYADAVFLLAAVGAFVLLEHDRPVLSGLAGAVATATRPIGIAVAVGLWARALERHGAFEGGSEWRERWAGALRGFVARYRGLLLAPLGLATYAVYLWARFGDPVVFVKAESAPLWSQGPGLSTWAKVAWFKGVLRPGYFDPPHLHLYGHALVTVVAIALVVLVFRHLGKGYGIYVLVLVVGSALSTQNFVGMGRYVMAAFPCFAVAGKLLSTRPAAQTAVIVTSAGLLLFLTQLHARNMLIS